MANGDSTADKAVRMQGRTGEGSPIHLADRTDGVNCEREKNRQDARKGTNSSLPAFSGLSHVGDCMRLKKVCFSFRYTDRSRLGRH